MGSLFSRSSSRSDGQKSLWKKTKVKRFQRMETSPEIEHFHNNNEHKNSNGDLINSHEEWKKRIEQQQHQLGNMNGRIN